MSVALDVMDDNDIEPQEEHDFLGCSFDFSFRDDKQDDHIHSNVDNTEQERYIVLSGKEKKNKKLELYKASIIGDWKKAEEILNKYPKYIKPTTRISELGETALHIATAADHTDFVRNLVDRLCEFDLAVKTTMGNTAFFYAAVSGNIQTATFMLYKNPNLSTIRGQANVSPIRTAALHGHEKMVRRIYQQCMNHPNLDDNDWLDVFMALIDCGVYDIGKKMLMEMPWLATKENSKEHTALYAFARKSRIPSTNLCAKGGFVRKHVLSKTKNEGLELLKLLLEKALSVVEETSLKLIKKAIFRAAKQGNYDFIRTVIDLHPDLAFELDQDNHTIFHIAVQHRHVEIFNLIHKEKSIKNVLKLLRDRKGNKILYLAAKKPSNGLEVVPGAALQLQRELLWFQEVEQVVGGKRVESCTNEKQKSLRDLFKDEHEQLRKEGEQWLTRTAESCMVVSTLIATVAFTGVFSVPGGNGQDTGIPVLLDNIWFKIFAITDAITLICLASSILFFLSILTSRYSMPEFLESLPSMLLLGLFSLFLSLIALMVAFIAAYFVVFKHNKHQFAYHVAVAAFIPIILVARWHLPHFYKIFRSTFVSFLQFRRSRFTASKFVLNFNKKNSYMYN